MRYATIFAFAALCFAVPKPTHPLKFETVARSYQCGLAAAALGRPPEENRAAWNAAKETYEGQNCKEIEHLLVVSSPFSVDPRSAGEDEYFDETIWPRDIFRCIREQSFLPVRGWHLTTALVMEYDGALDSDEFIVTAQKGVARKYFHVLVESGVDPENAQSVDTVRVKEVDSPDEDWNRNKWNEQGIWNADHTYHWVRSTEDQTIGVCDWGGFTMTSISRAECFHENDKDKTRQPHEIAKPKR